MSAQYSKIGISRVDTGGVGGWSRSIEICLSNDQGTTLGYPVHHPWFSLTPSSKNDRKLLTLFS